MTCRPSKALLAIAVLIAARAPASRAAAAATAVLDPAHGDAVPFPAVGAQFLRDAPPSLVLAATFPTPDLHAAFAAWTAKFARAYDGAHESARRKLVWLENHARIEAHNAGASSYSLAHNDFSDLTNDEFRRRHFLGEYSPGVKKPRGRREEASAWRFPSSTGRHLLRSGDAVAGGDEAAEATVAEVPDAKDWAAEGAVTAVKNQWFCGACWAYSAVGAIEGIRYIKTGNLTELSMQQLIDCDKTDLGCGGGLMDQAFQYEDKVGLCALAEYPMAYHRHWLWGCSVSDAPSPATWWHDGNCRPLPRTRVRKYVDVEAREAALKAAVATQPVSVAVAAGAWQFYSGGVLDASCEEQIDHGVLAVGYGQATASGTAGASGHDYWLIKNSWGTAWGDNGYIRLARGIGNEPTNGTACVLCLASRPVMSAED